MMRSVYLGTKEVKGSGGLATHWAVGVGEDKDDLLWIEVDGNSGEEATLTGPNTINGLDITWWRKKEPMPVLFQGPRARSGAGRKKLLGTTTRRDKEIQEFNSGYLERHPEYSVTRRNCQDYVYELVDWMVGSVVELPAREVLKYGAIGVGGVVAGGLAYYFYNRKRKEKERREKKEEEGNTDRALTKLKI